MVRLVTSSLQDERGAIQVEYALLACLIGAVTALGLVGLGDAMDGTYQPVVHASGSQSHDLPKAVAQ
jgi:Flp pilus assembly pilin Flp